MHSDWSERYKHDCEADAGNGFAIVYVLGLLGRRGYILPGDPGNLYLLPGNELCAYARALLDNQEFRDRVGRFTDHNKQDMWEWLRVNSSR